MIMPRVAGCPFGLIIASFLTTTATSAWAGPIYRVKSEAIAPPVTKLKIGSLITPDSGRTYYGTGTTHTLGLAVTNISPEIAALSSSLQGTLQLTNPADQKVYAQRVADYIRNNIKTEFRYGLSKGGRGALIDQSGTAFDQVDLMYLLLKSGSVSANIISGDATLTSAQFGKWTGLVTGLNEAAQTFTVNADAACQLLADGGIPATINGATSCSATHGNLSSVIISHVWIQLADGTIFDPSFKVSTLKAGIDIPAAMGCGNQTASDCGATVSEAGMNGAAQGSTGTGIHYISGYNLSAAKTAHNKLKAALTNYIKSQNINGQGINSSVWDVLGGKQLDPQVGTYAPLTYAAKSTWAAIPDQFRTRVTVKLPSNTCGAFFADEIGARALFYKQNVSNQYDGFYVDNRTIASLSYAAAGTCSGTATPYVQVTVDHPYAYQSGTYGDDTVNFKPVDPPSDEDGFTRQFRSSYLYFEGGIGVTPRQYVVGKQKATDFPEQNYLSPGAMMIVHEFGESGLTAQKSMSDAISVLDQPVEKCGVTTSNDLGFRQCDYNNYAITAETFAATRGLTNLIVEGVSKAITVRHHDIGIVYAGRGSGISILSTQESLSEEPLSGSTSDRQAAFDMSSLVLAEAESRANTIDSAPGISAARAFFNHEFINDLSGSAPKIYDIAPNQMASYLAALPRQASVKNGDGTTSYGSYCINYVDQTGASGGTGCWRQTQLQDVANLGYSTLIVEGGLGELFYAGTGERALTMFEYLKGGTTIGDAYGSAIKTTQVVDENSLRRKLLTVAPSSGELTFTAGPDIKTGVGDFPQSLSFQRKFSGSAKERSRSTSTYYYGASDPSPTPVNSTAAVTTGGDAQYHDRLGDGWTHNLQVRARYTNDLAYQLGSENALFAAELIANLQIVKDLGVSGILSNKIGSLFAINNMSRTVDGYLGGTSNTIVVDKGGPLVTFHSLYDGTYFSSKEPEATWSALSSRSFAYTSRDGDKISFSPYRYEEAYLNSSGNTLVGDESSYYQFKTLKADQWAFPTGEKVNYHYTATALSTPPGCYPGEAPTQYAGQFGYLLTSVDNSYGRSLSLTYDSPWVRQTNTQPCNPGFSDSRAGVYYAGYTYQPVKFVSYRLLRVTDENGRYATFDSNAVNGDYTTKKDYFTATDPLLGVNRYEYTAGSGSADPPLIWRDDYQLRRWFSPRNLSTPFQTIAYDDMFRVRVTTDINGNATRYFPTGFFDSEAWKRTEIINPLLNSTVLNFDQLNDEVLSLDPLQNLTRRSYDRTGRLVREVKPLGNAEEHTYDLRGNEIKNCLISSGRAGMSCNATSDLVATFTYIESGANLACTNLVTCNKIATSSDRRGNVTNYSWDASTGNLTQVLKPLVFSADDATNIRPEIDLAYISLNSIALMASKSEKISSSSTLTTGYEYNASNHYTLKSVVVDSGGLALRSCLQFDSYGNLMSKTEPNSKLASCP